MPTRAYASTPNGTERVIGSGGRFGGESGREGGRKQGENEQDQSERCIHVGAAPNAESVPRTGQPTRKSGLGIAAVNPLENQGQLGHGHEPAHRVAAEAKHKTAHAPSLVILSPDGALG